MNVSFPVLWLLTMYMPCKHTVVHSVTHMYNGVYLDHAKTFPVRPLLVITVDCCTMLSSLHLLTIMYDRVMS